MADNGAELRNNLKEWSKKKRYVVKEHEPERAISQRKKGKGRQKTRGMGEAGSCAVRREAKCLAQRERSAENYLLLKIKLKKQHFSA